MASFFSPSTPFICSSRIVSTTSSSSQPIWAVTEPYSRWVNAQTNNSPFFFFLFQSTTNTDMEGQKCREKLLGKKRCTSCTRPRQMCLSAATWSVRTSHATTTGVSNVHKITACTEMHLYKSTYEHLDSELTCGDL